MTRPLRSQAVASGATGRQGARSSPPRGAAKRGSHLQELDLLHERMSTIRAFEEAVAEGYRDGDIEGLVHLSIGAEAVAIGIASALTPDDRLFSAHRPHGHFLAMGVEPRLVMAELAGRETGLCRGRGGTMHLMSERAVMATGIVGGTLPIAVGHALHRPQGAVVVAVFGDGAVQTGVFHESMNLAALWRARVLFVCENNGWAEFSTRDQHTTVGNVARYGDLYGIPAAEVDGTDVEQVSAAARKLLPEVRAGRGPALLECHISRLRPHYEGDWRAQSAEGDPLTVAEQRLQSLGADSAGLSDRRDQLLAWARGLLASVLAEEPLPDPHDDAALVFEASLARDD
jgi:TPP-dependent pyruvate/acetoin dehydrogenase alpha subunit